MSGEIIALLSSLSLTFGADMANLNLVTSMVNLKLQLTSQ